MLAAGLIGLLVINLALVRDLPARTYGTDKEAALRRVRSQSIRQAPPTWNVTTPEGDVEQTIFYEWQNRVRATLDGRLEEREGIKAAVYDLSFQSEYHLTYPGPLGYVTVELFFPFPANLNTLHQVEFLVDGEEPDGVQYSLQGIGWQATQESGQERRISISYRAQGMDSFGYGLHHNRRSDVDIEITVTGLEGSKLHATSLPATDTGVSEGAQVFSWKYPGLIADRDIRLSLPSELGFAQRAAETRGDISSLALLAPVLVGLFIGCLALTLNWAGVRLDLLTCLLIGLSMALFYPAFALLTGLMPVGLAAVLALCLVSSLVILFLGLTAGWRRTWWRASWLLFIFLGILSLGMVSQWRGLMLFGGAFLLIATLMLLYARRLPVLEPEPPPAETPSAEEPPEVAVGRHCPHCGRALDETYDYCPGCGKDAHLFCTCVGCGHEQLALTDPAPAHCVRCGQLLG
jgi:hypothetical protein